MAGINSLAYSTYAYDKNKVLRFTEYINLHFPEFFLIDQRDQLAHWVPICKGIVFINSGGITDDFHKQIRKDIKNGFDHLRL